MKIFNIFKILYFFFRRKKSRSFNETECPICLDKFCDKDNYILSCGHKYHVSCIKQMLDFSYKYIYSVPCPTCRRLIKKRDIITCLKIEEDDKSIKKIDKKNSI